MLIQKQQILGVNIDSMSERLLKNENIIHRALESSWDDVRESAIFALGKQRKNKNLYTLILTSVYEHCKDLVSATDWAIGYTSPSWHKTEEAKKAIPELIKALGDEIEDTRIAALGFLEKIDTRWRERHEVREAFSYFIKRLESKDELKRLGAAWAISKFGRYAKYYIPTLKEKIRKEKNEQVIKYLAKALYEML